jgi:23S rRNA pseudouridine2605 synthase
VKEYVYPVGRLDYDSEGLLLLTSDGDLAAHLTHPRHGIEREYEVRVKGVPDGHDLDRLSRGISLEGRRTAPAIVELTKVIEAESGPQALLSFVIHEGRNRQVRNMCDAIGHPVVRLRRRRIGPITDERIRPGEFRELTDREVALLRKVSAGDSRSLPPEGGSHASERVASAHNSQGVASGPSTGSGPARAQSRAGFSRKPATGARRTTTARPKSERAARSRGSREGDRPRRG